MGHGQTARGLLRFQKTKESVADQRGLIKVKVSGVLKAEGAVVGNLVKDGTYAVTGEQSYDPASFREWKTARWSVAVRTELANANGVTLAHGQGNMLVQTQALGAPLLLREAGHEALIFARSASGPRDAVPSCPEADTVCRGVVESGAQSLKTIGQGGR